jgi:eukaryotic-like serine/threonine-protein kinase
VDPQVIGGRYEVVRAVGRGGMGTVWLCRDTVLDREVAVKQIGALPGEPAAAARAMREARIAASLNHPNAVGVYDILDEDDSHWLVMEYVENQTLAEVARQAGGLAPQRVAAIGAAVAGALARAHERGIVHRDIKPGNILLARGCAPKISDFGIARAHADDQLTQTGFMTGTPSYLAPELARGGNPTSASDVWALGASLYYAVEGQGAYEAQPNPLATLQNIAAGRARPMEEAGPLAGAIRAMMDPDPDRRWDMATAARRLDEIAHGDKTLALPAGAALAVDPAATEVIPEGVAGTQRLEAATRAPAAAAGPAAYPPQAPRDPQRRRTSPWVPIVIILLVAALAALAYALYRANSGGTPAPSTTTSTSSPPTTASTKPSTSSSSTSTSSTTTKTTSTSTTTTTTDASPQGAQSMERFVQGYYRDVTNDKKRDITWAQLTPAMQDKSGGRQAYDQFWSQFTSVATSNAKADPKAGTVTIDLNFKRAGGDDTAETHVLTLVKQGDSWLIDNDARTGG